MAHRIAHRTSALTSRKSPSVPLLAKGEARERRGIFGGRIPKERGFVGGWCGSVYAGDRRGFLGGGHQQAAFPGMQMALNRQVLADHLGLLERGEQTRRAVQPD